MAAKTGSQQKALDLVFVCDCTGSMGSYLAAAQKNITSIVTEISSSASVNVRFALVQYRDHPPEDRSFVVKASPFTSSLPEMVEMVSCLHADGGGDTPEAVTDGLFAALSLPWRDDAAKVICFIADAPPHGLMREGSDGFPNGCPCEKDPLQVVKQIAVKGIVIYCVGAEPGLSSSCPLARDFMRAVAEITAGVFLPLASANLLAKVIVAGAVEQVQLRDVLKGIAEEVRKIKAEHLKAGSAPFTDEETQKFVAQRLQESKIQTTQIALDDVYGGQLGTLNTAWMQYSLITDVRDKLSPATPVGVAPPPYSSVPHPGRDIESRVAESWSRACSMAPTTTTTTTTEAPEDESECADFSFSGGSSAAPVAPSAEALAQQTVNVSTGFISPSQASRVYQLGANMDLFS